MNLRTLSCAVIDTLSRLITHPRIPVEIVSVDNLPDSLSAEIITVGNATFSGGVIGSFGNVPTNRTKQYVSQGRSYPTGPEHSPV